MHLLPPSLSAAPKFRGRLAMIIAGAGGCLGCGGDDDDNDDDDDDAKNLLSQCSRKRRKLASFERGLRLLEEVGLLQELSDTVTNVLEDIQKWF